MADGVGFEPTVRCRTLDFESSTFDHSDTHPTGLFKDIYYYSTKYNRNNSCKIKSCYFVYYCCAFFEKSPSLFGYILRRRHR